MVYSSVVKLYEYLCKNDTLQMSAFSLVSFRSCLLYIAVTLKLAFRCVLGWHANNGLKLVLIFKISSFFSFNSAIPARMRHLN